MIDKGGTLYKYFKSIYELLEKVEKEEKQTMDETIDTFVQAIENKNSLFVFGASHAGILTQELYYRAGGLMLINPIFAESLQLNIEPITHSSQMERLEGYGDALANKASFKEGDVLLLHSVSGRNPVIIDLALKAKELGVKVISITNLTYSKEVESRHSSGKKLYQVSDIVIDNHGHKGDGVIELDSGQRTGPSSTVIGTTIVNNIVVETVEKLIERGNETPPIFYSANLDEGDALNQKLYEEYKDSIHYRF